MFFGECPPADSSTGVENWALQNGYLGFFIIELSTSKLLKM